MNKYYFTTEIAKLINPPLHSKLFEKQKNSHENIYFSRRKAPLGCAPVPNIPSKATETIFGASSTKDITAVDLMFPSKSKISQSVYSDEFSYKKCTDSIRPAGFKLEYVDNSGKQVKELLNYDKNNYSAVIRPSSYAKKVSHLRFDLKENVSCDNIEEKTYVITENKNEFNIKKSKKGLMDKYLVEVVWNLLKIKNHENFEDLASAFKAYKSGSDKITLLDLQKMCQEFGISAPLHVLEKLLEKCDIIDKDGALSFEEFMHSLNWKDMLPENHHFKNIKYANDWKEGINNLPEAIIDCYRTTTSFIGDHKHPVSSRSAGLLSHRKDTDSCKFKSVSKFGECGDVSTIIQPNAFAKYGIFEEDLSTPFPKEEIKLFLRNSGILFNDGAFEMVWQNVNNNDKASIGTVWSALKKNCLLSYQDL